MKEAKEALRRAIRLRKSQHTAEERNLLDAALWNQLERHPRFMSARTLLLYYSLEDEVNTHDFLRRWCKEKKLLLPVVKGDVLELRRYTGEADLQKGVYGIMEPVGELVTDYAQIDLALIPGMAFDKECNRLGRGKGYYDRLLPKLTSYNIGVCYACQVTEAVPCEPFDKKMDAVVTDEGFLNETESPQ